MGYKEVKIIMKKQKKAVPKKSKAPESGINFENPENSSPQRVNIDIPVGMINMLDQEANRIGVPRTSLIKMWIAEKLDKI